MAMSFWRALDEWYRRPDDASWTFENDLFVVSDAESLALGWLGEETDPVRYRDKAEFLCHHIPPALVLSEAYRAGHDIGELMTRAKLTAEDSLVINRITGGAMNSPPHCSFTLAEFYVSGRVVNRPGTVVSMDGFTFRFKDRSISFRADTHRTLYVFDDMTNRFTRIIEQTTAMDFPFRAPVFCVIITRKAEVAHVSESESD